jgi:phage terminase large subunit-like protein
MTLLDPVTQFADDITNSRKPSGELLRLACERHLNDLCRADCDYTFDEAKANQLYRFFRQLRHFKGEWAGSPIELEPFQMFMVGSLFGWVSKDTKLRRFRQCFFEQPRGQGKSTIAAGVGLWLAFFDKEPGAEVYCCATHRAQAKITWEAARQMVLRSKLRNRVEVRVNNLHNTKSASKMEPLGADADQLDGLRPNGVILDEIHAHKSSAMIDVMTTATGTRRQPLTFEITTAGVGQTGVCWDHHDYTSKIVRGVVQDDTWFGVIIAADKDDDWKSPDTWLKANPNLGKSVKVDDIERKAKQATHITAFESEFRRLHLGQWVQQSERYLSMKDWDAEANAAPIDRAALRGLPCVIGLDVSSKFDFTAAVAIFKGKNDSVIVLPTIWAPQAIVDQSRRALVPLSAWQQNGFLKTTPGNVIDQQFIRKELNDMAKEFKVKEIAFDSWNAMSLATELESDGLNLVEVRQGFKTLSEPTKDLSIMLATGRLNHGGHPVLRWMADNLTVRSDANGNVVPDKQRAVEKIDAVVALVMALSRKGQLNLRRSSGMSERGLLVI